MSELEKANTEQSIEKSSLAPSIANQVLQSALRVELENEDLNNEENYADPSGKVNWEDTIYGFEALRKKNMRNGVKYLRMKKDLFLDVIM